MGDTLEGSVEVHHREDFGFILGNSIYCGFGQQINWHTYLQVFFIRQFNMNFLSIFKN